MCNLRFNVVWQLSALGNSSVVLSSSDLFTRVSCVRAGGCSREARTHFLYLQQIVRLC